jgi:hypothetical protein
MEPDRIRIGTDSDISDICLLVSFQFPSPRMEMDWIHMETDSNNLGYSFSYFFRFPFELCNCLPSCIWKLHRYGNSCHLDANMPGVAR